MPIQQKLSKTEKPINDPGHNPCLSSPRVRDNSMPSPVSTPAKPISVQRKTPFSLSGRDANVGTMSSQHYKELVSKLTSSLPKPYGAIPTLRQRRQNLKPTNAPSSIMRDNMAESEEKDDFGAFPLSPPGTPPSVWSSLPFGSHMGANGKPTPKLTKRQSMPTAVPKSSPSICAITPASASVAKLSSALPPKKSESTPSRSSRTSLPNSLLLLSTNNSPPLSPTSSTTNRFSLYKFSISPPSSTYATLRSLNPFSASPPVSPSSAEKSPMSQPAISSPTVSLGRFFTFLDDVAPVVAAAGGELVGISEMPKWAGMGGTTSATVSTLSLLLRNNDRLRSEMQLDNLHPLAQTDVASSEIKKCHAPSPSPSTAAAAAAAAGAPPAPLVVPGAQHLHLREPRLNPAYLRMMAAEMNMMRAGKLVGPLRPRGWLPRRRDPWDHTDLSRRSDLRKELDVDIAIAC